MISQPIEMNQNEEDHAAPDSPFQKHVIKRVPTREEIEQRAYKLFLARGAGDGHDLEDWIQAERELQEGDNRVDEGAVKQHSPHR
jgi:hypothetical protein